jgi:hypothetical protein
VVVEKISDFDTPHGRDADGDGFGGDGDVVTTPCVPPAGYVRGVSDCDDRDPEIFPGAVERCDDVDNDCNGLGDDGACAVGGGGCSGGGLAPGGPWILLAIGGALALARALRPRGPR